MDMLVIGEPIADKVIRTVAVYFVVLVLLRLAGKRELAQLNTFDLVVMLLLANVVQNAIIGPDNSVSGAVIGAAVLLSVNSLVVRAAAVWPFLYRLLEGTPTVVASDGKFDLPAIRRLGLRPADVKVAVKKQGGDRMSETTRVTVEPGGSLLVQLRPEDESASAADIARLNSRLDGIDQRLKDLADRPA